jgi:glycosyltransferase involved in cell wall biosynthesis
MAQQINRLNWLILTGEYPPDPGGVSDYTCLVAEALAAAGDAVKVWAPPTPDLQSTRPAVIAVHRLPDHFGLRSLSILSRVFRQLSVEDRVLVQYVPQSFGCKGMNLLFCLWLWLQRRRCRITVMFHEVATPWRKTVGWRQIAETILAVTTRLMALLVARWASRLYVSIPSWEKVLRPLAGDRQIQWLPIPSTIETTIDDGRAASLRAELIGGTGAKYLVGHFGTFRGHVSQALQIIAPKLLRERTDILILLVGRHSKEFAHALQGEHSANNNRMLAMGALSSSDAAHHLAACDLLFQPYVDGISSRRTSAMAGLAMGIPIVTTFGFLSEPIWKETRAVCLVNSVAEIADAVSALLDDSQKRKQIGAAGQELYRERFQITHTVEKLRADMDVAPSSVAR